MTAATRLLDDLAPGELTAVVGRPGCGVSTLLGRLASLEAARGGGAVLAPWECAAERLSAVIGAGVVIPDIVGWGIDELIRSRAFTDAPSGALVCVDHLQLIGSDSLATVSALRDAARSAPLRVVVGVMAPRSLEHLDGEIGAVRATSAVADALGPLLAPVDRVAVILGAGSGESLLAVSAAGAGARPLLRWSERLN